MQLIALKQFDQAAISGFIINCVTGNTISGLIQPYFNNTGWVGNGVVYATGLNQDIKGVKSFVSSPQIPYSGGTGSAVSKQYLLDVFNSFGDVYLVRTGFAQTVSGVKSFVVPPLVPMVSASGEATPKRYVDESIYNSGQNYFFLRTGNSQIGSGALRYIGNFILTGAPVGGGSSSIMFQDSAAGEILEMYPSAGWLSLDTRANSTNALWFNPTNSFLEDNAPSGTICLTSGLLCVDAARTVNVNWRSKTLSGQWTAGTGLNVSGRYVITGLLPNAGLTVLAANGILYLNATGLTVTGSQGLHFPNFQGAGTTVVVQSGNNVLVSGQGSTLTVSGSSTIGNPNFLSAGTTVVIQSGSNILISGANTITSLTVTGSSSINSPNFQGAGTTVVVQSGNNILMSGAGGASTLTVTGSTAITSPNFIGINSTKIIRSGDNILVSGLDTSVTGGAPLGSTNYIGIFGVQVIQSGNNTILISGSGINTQNYNIISGQSGTTVSVTGSAYLTGTDFRGAGTTKIIYSGDNFVLVSGLLQSSVTTSGSSLISAPNFLSAGTTVVVQSGSNILISGIDSSKVTVTGSPTLFTPNFQGAGTTVVITSGNNVLISGVGGGGSSVTVTGSSAITSPNFIGTGNVQVIREGNDILISGNNSFYSIIESISGYYSGDNRTHTTLELSTSNVSVGIGFTPSENLLMTGIRLLTACPLLAQNTCLTLWDLAGRPLTSGYIIGTRTGIYPVAISHVVTGRMKYYISAFTSGHISYFGAGTDTASRLDLDGNRGYYPFYNNVVFNALGMNSSSPAVGRPNTYDGATVLYPIEPMFSGYTYKY